MAETYGTRPSEIVGLSEPWAAFTFDEALFIRYRLHLADQEDDAGGRPSGVRKFDPPPRQVRVKIPWAGKGADPLGGTL
jgi:hypothetical protein